MDDVKAALRRNVRDSLRAGSFERAEAALDQLKAEDPLAVETRGLELECLVRSGRLEEARPLARQLVALFPDSARILYLAGLLSYRLKHYRSAERHLRESHRLHPHWWIQHLLGKTLTQLGEFDEAESTLLPIAAHFPPCRLDLAWLYERRNEVERALQEVERYLEGDPENSFALDCRLRLRSKLLDPAETIEEVENLLALDEAIPEQILPTYVEALLRSGQGARAREFIRAGKHEFTTGSCQKIAWVCYRLEAPDLAYDLFVRVFPENRDRYKFLGALESAARRCDRLQELLELYRKHAPEAKLLYGRMKTLRRRLESG